MTAKSFASQVWQGARAGLASLVMLQMSLAGPMVGSAQAKEHDGDGGKQARTPIQHVIVIVGENRTFDHIFATYEPKKGETVNNLLSEHIVKADGTPGSNFAFAQQYAADATDSATFQLAPKKKTLYSPLPAPLNGGPTDVCKNNGICSLGDAMSSENGLADDYYTFLTSGGTGLSGKVPDSRINGVNAVAPYSTLPPGPFQLTDSKQPNPFTNDSYAASPVHRFYQMWQQEDCDASHISKAHPNGCLADLFAWTELTVGSNNNGKPAPTPTGFDTDYSPTAHTTGEGATTMGFYNMAQGDAPYTKFLADHFAISDNYHQPAMGGTGLDSIMLFFGDPIWFSNPDGTPGTPPHNEMTWAGGPVDEVENPNPVPGTNNFWIQDGYGGFGNLGASTGVYGGGSYTDCADASQPGVAPILNYLSSLPRPIEPKCDAGHYYLLNNYNPGYFGDGSNAYTDTNSNNTPFTIPPTSQRSIGDVLLENHVSWKSYNDQWNAYLGDKYQLNYGTVGPNSDQYCNICNGFHYQTQIMANDAVRTAHIKDTTDLYADIASGDLPAVSFVKPSGWVDGHPASSKWDLYEGFVKKIVDAVQSNKKLWESTAIIVTVDEGGGYYDSGYVQALDFFGDGTRIPLIVVSKYTNAGHISHQYTDHVSVLKFIERNWNLPTVSGRSRDNLPNPKAETDNPYVPTNTPALGDLFDLFDFGGDRDRR
ncbi:MAG TPA: alkaline phosphatase family protein [Candidatus Sulfotelmatobacter sp.]|jgi:phospholipase C|nr:alkaline phosphatase family protein [Candidatus Sulfotelmatobacter sp.]